MLNILFLGIVSFLIDFSTEMVYPLLPLFLTSALGATPAVIGIIEGIAESLASLLKVFSGYVSDKYRNNKLMIFLGYSGSIIYKLILLAAASWPAVLAGRIVDRFGKGVRTAPRDALVAASSPEKKLGGSFGLHKMLDMAGTALGILAAYFLVSANGLDYKLVFGLSLIPAALGIVMISFVKNKKPEAHDPKKINLDFRKLDSRLKIYLAIVFVFTLGNSSNAFLLLRAKDLGFGDMSVILLYLLFSAVASLFAYPFGKLSDKIGRRVLLVTGYALYGVTYIGLALAAKGDMTTVVCLFAVYGLYTAMTAGVERALICRIAPCDMNGTVLGLHATLTGIGLLPASLIAGFLWNTLGAPAPFWFGGTLGLLAAAAMFILLSTRGREDRSQIQ